MAKITYKGITQNSGIEHKLTDEEFKQIAIDFYKKQLKKIHNGGTLMNKIYEYYLKEVMSKAILKLLGQEQVGQYMMESIIKR